MARLRDRVEVLWPATAIVNGVTVDDWTLPLDRTTTEAAAVDPAEESSSGGADPEPVTVRADCYLGPAAEITPRCRVRWNGQTYALAGDVDSWRSGTHVRYQRVTLVRVIGVTPAHQLLPAALMTAVLSLRKPGVTQGAFDDETGKYTTTPHAPYLSGVPGEVEALANAPRDVEAAGDMLTVTGYRLRVPLYVTGVEVGDLVTISGTGDLELDGLVLRVEGTPQSSQATRRELLCSIES